MTSTTNKDCAIKWIRMAQMELKSGNLDAAEKLLEKAEKYYPSEKGRKLLKYVNEAIEDTRKNRKQNLRDRKRPSPQVKKYTAEQVEAVKRVHRCANYYEILEVSTNSNKNQIVKAYRMLSLKLHPDKNRAPGADEAFKKLLAAKVCLLDSGKRQIYDRENGFNITKPSDENNNRAHSRQKPNAQRNRNGPQTRSSSGFTQNSHSNSNSHQSDPGSHQNGARPKQNGGSNSRPNQNSSGSNRNKTGTANGFSDRQSSGHENSGNTRRQDSPGFSNNTGPFGSANARSQGFGENSGMNATRKCMEILTEVIESPELSFGEKLLMGTLFFGVSLLASKFE